MSSSNMALMDYLAIGWSTRETSLLGLPHITISEDREFTQNRYKYMPWNFQAI